MLKNLRKSFKKIKKVLTNMGVHSIIPLARLHGGIAQLARAFGSYPKCRRFKSTYRYQFGPVVKRLRHGPFTAVTRVRFPSGSPKKNRPANETCGFFGRFFVWTHSSAG